jgi:hypothetical protein
VCACLCVRLCVCVCIRVCIRVCMSAGPFKASKVLRDAGARAYGVCVCACVFDV